jgi:hypothetical protein
MFATTLVAMFLDAYGSEALSWEPLAIEIQIEEDNGLEIPRENFERLMAAIAILTTNSFFLSVVDFARLCVILSGNSVPSDILALPDSDDIAWGVTEALLLSPPETENPFNEEITAFMGKVLDAEGIITPPDVLRIATRDNKLVDRVQYDFSDDPVMFNAMFDMETSKTETINAIVTGRMLALVNQLSKAGLKNANTESMKRFVSGALQKLKDAQEVGLG